MAEESSINPDLQDLHDTLVQQMVALVDRMGEAETIDEAQKIQGQLTEVNHRVTRVGSLLFTQKTKAITKAMDKVRGATKETNKAIKEVKEILKFLKTITAFLVLVDKVIDTADLVMPVG